MALRIRRDDTVKVISGKDSGKTGRVLRVNPEKQKVYVEGLNIQKRHQRPRTIAGTTSGDAGVVEREGPIHISNVMLVDPATNAATRVGVRRENGVRIRVARSTGNTID